MLLSGPYWDLTWTPDPRNRELQVAYNCPGTKKHPPFWAVNTWDISGKDDHAQVRKVPTPYGQVCRVTAAVVRTAEGTDWVAEMVAMEVVNKEARDETQ